VLVVDDEDGIARHSIDFSRGSAIGCCRPRAAPRRSTASRGVAAGDAVRHPHAEHERRGARAKALAADSDLAIIMLTAIDEPRTAIECLKLGAYDYLIKPVDLDELEMSLQAGLRQRQLEIDRRELEQWLAREVAVRTRDLEERTTVVEDIALAALAAAGDCRGRATPSRSWRRSSARRPTT